MSVRPYPIHGDIGESSATVINGCGKQMILPLQVPIRGAYPAHLYCIGCAKLVAVSADVDAQARAAAAHDGFVPPGDPPATLLPGMLSDVDRRGLYWAKRLLDGTVPTEKKDDAERAVRSAAEHLRVLGVMVIVPHPHQSEGHFAAPPDLTDAGRALAALIVDPPIDPRVRAFDDPSLGPARREKRPSRKVLIVDKIPRCRNTRCWSPLDRDGKCMGGECGPCGYVEEESARLSDLSRMWDYVDERAPARKPKAKKSVAP